MAPELSTNWKKLQAQLKKDSTENNLKRKAPHSESQLGPLGKRKQLDTKMGIGISSPKVVKDSEPSESLALWAEDNGISTNDLLEAYGGGTHMKTPVALGSTPNSINAGLSDAVAGQYVAIDCEMVGVGGEEDRSALARVSIVNFHGEQVYDSFVRPKEFVTDWRTHVSGVSPKNMATARKFEEVQRDVAELLKDRILVGHAVKNDLDALMLDHPKRDIRDTSRFPPFRKFSAGKTPSLKKLAKEILGVDIQDGAHSSVVDAQATMMIFRDYKQAFESHHAQRYPAHVEKKPKQRKKSKNKR